MEFGKVADISRVKLDFPEDQTSNLRILNQSKGVQNLRFTWVVLFG